MLQILQIFSQHFLVL